MLRTQRHLCVYSPDPTRLEGGRVQAQAHSLAPEATACKHSKPDPLDMQIPGVYTLTIPDPFCRGPSVPHAAPAWPILAWPETNTSVLSTNNSLRPALHGWRCLTAWVSAIAVTSLSPLPPAPHFSGPNKFPSLSRGSPLSNHLR